MLGIIIRFLLNVSFVVRVEYHIKIFFLPKINVYVYETSLTNYFLTALSRCKND